MQSLTFWIFLLIFVCNFWPVEVAEECGKRSDQVLDTIHNGRRTDFYDYPWLAALFIMGDHVGLTFTCGGTLISRNVVLTAAHCLYIRNSATNEVIRRRSPEEIIVYLGRYHLLNWGDFDYSVAKEVKKIIVHDDYGEGKSKLIGDIALLVLKKPAAFSSNIQSVCLPDIKPNGFSPYQSHNGTVVGWGVDEDGNQYSSTPNVANSTIFFNDECQEIIKFQSLKSFNEVMCAGYKDGRGSCNGDSGGGFYVEITSANGEHLYFVYGVLSKAFPRKDGNCDHSKPSIVTNVVHYMEWIQSHVDTESASLNMKKKDKLANKQLDKNLKQCCVQMHQEREDFSKQLESCEDEKDVQAIEVKKMQTAKEHILNFANMRFETASKIEDFENYDEALALYQDVTEIRKTFLGEDNKNTLSSMFETARVLNKLLRYNESLALYDEIIKSRNKTLGENHTETLTAMHNKAWVLGELSYYNESLKLYDKVIHGRTDVLGELHKKTLQSLQDKADILQKLERYNEAIAAYNKLIELRNKTLGENHTDTLRAMYTKAKVLYKLKNYDESLKLYDKVINLETDVLGEDHEDTLISMHEKARILQELGRYNEALTTYNKLIELRNKTLGENHPDTVRAMYNKAFVLGKLNNYDESLKLYDKVINWETAVFGEQHEVTLQSVHEKALILKKLG